MSKPSKSWPEVRARNCASKAKRASFSDWNLFRDAAEALREHGQSAGRIGDEAYAVYMATLASLLESKALASLKPQRKARKP